MELGKQPININITSLTIIKVLAILLLLYFFFVIKDVLILFFISLVFSSALDPWVDWLKKKKIPRGISVLGIYLIVFAVLATVLYLIMPPIIKEVNDLANNFPSYFESLVSKFSAFRDYSIKFGLLDNIKESLNLMASYLQNTASGVFTTVVNIFGGIFSLILILVLTFYMVVEESAMKKLVWSVAPEKHQPYLMQLINRMQLKMGYWLRGQLILALSLSIMIYVGLSILGVIYALILALLVGLFSFIPFMGAILGSIPTVFIAFTQSPLLAVLTVILFYVANFVEDNLLYPKIMQKAVGLNPIISILAMLTGFKLAGVIGAILSIPVTAAVSVFIKDIFDSREDRNRGEEEA